MREKNVDLGSWEDIKRFNFKLTERPRCVSDVVAFYSPNTWISPFFKGWEPRFFVVMCNTVCTVCKKEEKKEQKKRHKSLLQIYFHCEHCDSLKSFSTVYLLDVLVPSSSNVALYWEIFSLFFRFLQKKDKN